MIIAITGFSLYFERYHDQVKLGAIITCLETPESNMHNKFLGFVYRDFIVIRFFKV